MAASVSHDAMANAIRFLALDAVEKAKSGHPGLPMGSADVATVLWRDVLKFAAATPALIGLGVAAESLCASPGSADGLGVLLDYAAGVIPTSLRNTVPK